MTLKKDAEMLMVFSTSERSSDVSNGKNYNELFTKAVTTEIWIEVTKGQ